MTTIDLSETGTTYAEKPPATTTMMFMVLIGALTFSTFVNVAGLPGALEAMVNATDLPPAAVLALVLLMYLVLGMVLESLSMVLLTVPIFFPLVMQLGFDPVWFGILIVVIVEIGLISPPVGMNLFVIQSLTGRDLLYLARAALPFFLVMVIMVALLIAFPELATYLPQQMTRG